MQEVFTTVIQKAINDYYLLLNKGYPQKSILKLVGDKFKLTGSQRTILYRGVCKYTEAQSRMQKLINQPSEVEMLYIDGYNVLLTMGNYLMGRPLFIGNDGFLRDSGEIHGKIRKSKKFTQSVDILMEVLQGLAFTETIIYLDQPIPYSADLAVNINDRMTSLDIQGNANVVRHPDYHLKQVKSGILVTSDSAIIDKTYCRIFDLARYSLEKKYNPDFPKIEDFVSANKIE